MDIARVTKLLAAAEAEYVLIGGVALYAHGSSHLTDDVDIAYRHTPENVRAIVAALTLLNPRLRVKGEPDGVPFLFDAKTIGNGRNFTMVTDVGDLDILADVDGFANYDELAQYKETIDAFGREIPVLNLEGLLRAKEALLDKPHRGMKDAAVLPEIRGMLAEKQRRRR